MSASRFPAAAIYQIQGANFLMVSFHATSGGGNKSTSNVTLVKAAITQYMQDNKNVSGCILGGDLNEFIDKSDNIKNGFGDFSFKQPNLPTNQGSHHGKSGIDGFLFVRSEAFGRQNQSCFSQLSKWLWPSNQAIKSAMRIPTGMQAKRMIEEISNGKYKLVLKEDTKIIVDGLNETPPTETT